MNSFIKDNRGTVIKTVIGMMALALILAFIQNSFLLNARFEDYCKAGLGGFIALFFISYIGLFGRSYNIYKYPKLLRTNNIFFFILGIVGFMGSTSYMIYFHNAMAIPDYFFGSCGAIIATALQTNNIDDRIPQKFVVDEGKQEVRQSNQNGTSKWLNVLCTLIALTIFIGAIFLIEWFYPNLFDIVRLD